MPGSANLTDRPMTRRRGVVRLAAAAVLLGSLALGASGGGAADAWAAWSAGTAPDAADAAEAVGHLVVSEVMTGGASASDEFIELYNPTATTLPLEGLEVIYVTASGATVSRKADWSPGAVGVPPGGHVLVANEAGAYAAVADLTYANGLAATGGSVALRIRDAATAIDAVGWGSAASTWLEGMPAPAVSAGHSLERLPGGAAGSGQDTDQNAVDFADEPVPEPQNAAAPPISASPPPGASLPVTGSPVPTAPPTTAPSPTRDDTPAGTSTMTATAIQTPTLAPTGTPTPTLSASPMPAALSIAAARLLPDGSVATIEGVSLTDAAFTDGGGYLADTSGGIAVIVSGGSFARGEHLRITGELDDRFHQRTLRVDAADVVVVGSATGPEAVVTDTGAVNEAVEGQLIVVTAGIASSATELSNGVAFDIDDGSGPTRLVVLATSGIDHSAWTLGTLLQVRGVVGQRDSSGTGTLGYRLQPRDAADVIAVSLPTPTPSTSPSQVGTSSPSPSNEPGVVDIAAARAASVNARVRVRGVVTLASNVLADGTAAIQDRTGAIILRLGDEAGDVSQGEVLVVDAKRSTKSGMETLLVSSPPERRGSQAQPDAERHATGELGEEHEALLVVVRGDVVTAPRRSSAENVYFDLDDGSGPLRVYISPRTGISAAAVTAGATLELTGVLGQETSGQQPLRGYRLWPRVPADVKVMAGADSGGAGSDPPGLGADAPGGLGPLGGSIEAKPTRAPDLAVPQLGAPRLPRPDVTPAPTPDLAAGLQPTASDAASDHAPLLAVAAALLAGIGGMAAVQPGIVDRLRLALARSPGAAADSRDGPPSEHRETAPDRAGSLEGTVARLVPLAVLDDVSAADPVPSTASRSRARRILPPT